MSFKSNSRLHWFVLLRSLIGWQNSPHVFNQREARQKKKKNTTMVPRSYTFSHAWRRLHEFAANSDSFIALFASAVRAIALVLVLRHSIENRSIDNNSTCNFSNSNLTTSVGVPNNHVRHRDVPIPFAGRYTLIFKPAFKESSVLSDRCELVTSLGSSHENILGRFRRYNVCLRLSHAISRARAARVMQKNRTQLSSFNIAYTYDCRRI